MRRMTWLCLFAAVAGLQCGTETTEQPGGDEPPLTVDGLFAFRYVQQGDTLLVTVDTARCVSAELRRDTVERQVPARVSGDSLVLVLPDTFYQGAVARHTLRCARSDTTTGLTGKWRVTARQSTLQGGQLTAYEDQRLARDTAVTDSMIAQDSFFVTFRDGVMSGEFTGSRARVLLPIVMAEQPAFAHITVDTAADGASVSIVGEFTGETVTVAFDARLNRRYSCVPAGRSSYTDWQYEESCTGVQPWFADFLSDNVSFGEWFQYTYRNLSLQIDVEIVVVDDFTVRVEGGQSGEVVTVTCNAQGEVTYTSTNPQHTTHQTSRVLTVPPTWWSEFCNQNLYP